MRVPLAALSARKRKLQRLCKGMGGMPPGITSSVAAKLIEHGMLKGMTLCVCVCVCALRKRTAVAAVADTRHVQ